VQIGTVPKAGLVYEWRPAAGLSNPNIANPFASPDVTTTYIVTTRNTGGGCVEQDTVVVRAAIIDSSLLLLGRATYCIGSGDSAVLKVQPTDSIQWFKNNVAINGANKTTYRVTETGLYYALLFNKLGCSIATSTRQINISSVPVAGFTPPATPNQCLVGNEFLFSNNSTNAVGDMQYKWILGDGTEASTRDVTHSYTAAGTYKAKMIVRSNSVCADSSSITIQIYPNAVADFSVRPVCIELPLQPINNTVDTLGSPVNYAWNLGNGQVSNIRTPPPQIFSVPGTYTISLSVNTAQCPTPIHTARRTVVIDRPTRGISYPVQYAIINLPLTLRAREVGESALWSPGINLSSRTTFDPVFKGSSEQLYTIELKTASGCLTVDTQLVKTVKNVEMHVPTAFSPNNDGRNDFLKPILIGVKQLRFFRVYNRWGQLLYEMQGEKPGWDGTFRGLAQQTQTVVWMAEALGVDGNTYTGKGTTVLLR
jgi:gliding motility-associated-like protein